MKKATLVLLCCTAFLYACDSSKDTASDAINDTSEKATGGLDKTLESARDTTASIVDSAKEKASETMDAAREAASEAMTEGKELKDTAVKSTSAAVDSARESVSTAVDNTIIATKDISSAVVTKTGEMIASVGADDIKQGESIYKSKCVACHGTGAAGAPKLADKAAWGPRITQGNEVLSKHAIEGFKGNAGYMPPKGGYMSLSDDEVSLAVLYMVSQAQ